MVLLPGGRGGEPGLIRRAGLVAVVRPFFGRRGRVGGLVAGRAGCSGVGGVGERPYPPGQGLGEVGGAGRGAAVVAAVEELVSGGQDLLRVPSGGGGAGDGGDEGGPATVGEDAVGGGLAEDGGQRRGPGRPHRAGGAGGGGVECGGGEVVGEAPPQRGGGHLVGEGTVGADADGEGVDVDAGAGGGVEPVGELRPVRVGGDPPVDRVGGGRPCPGGGVRVAEGPVEPVVEGVLRAGVGHPVLRRSGQGGFGVGHAERGPPDGDVEEEVGVAVEEWGAQGGAPVGVHRRAESRTPAVTWWTCCARRVR